MLAGCENIGNKPYHHCTLCNNKYYVWEGTDIISNCYKNNIAGYYLNTSKYFSNYRYFTK